MCACARAPCGRFGINLGVLESQARHLGSCHIVAPKSPQISLRVLSPRTHRALLKTQWCWQGLLPQDRPSEAWELLGPATGLLAIILTMHSRIVMILVISSFSLSLSLSFCLSLIFSLLGMSMYSYLDIVICISVSYLFFSLLICSEAVRRQQFFSQDYVKTQSSADALCAFDGLYGISVPTGHRRTGPQIHQQRPINLQTKRTCCVPARWQRAGKPSHAYHT